MYYTPPLSIYCHAVANAENHYWFTIQLVDAEDTEYQSKLMFKTWMP